MTRDGIALVQSFTHTDLGAALDALPRLPDIVPVWARGLQVDRCALDAVRAKGCEPYVYATTHGLNGRVVFASSGDQPAEQRKLDDDIYPAILRGEHDETIRAFARSLPEGTVVRLDPEPNSDPRAHWQRVAPGNYWQTWRHMYHVLKAERSDLRLMWCLTWRGLAKANRDWLDYLPGPLHVDIVAWDVYWNEADWYAKGNTPSKRLARILDFTRQRWSGPVSIAETGVRRGAGHRRPWLRDIDTVKGYEAIVHYAMKSPEEGPDKDYRWNKKMWRAWEAMG